MCNCINEIEEKALSHLREKKQFKKPVNTARLHGVTFPLIGDTLISRTCNMLKVELEGQKKQPEIIIAHSYCPFCGEKYETA